MYKPNNQQEFMTHNFETKMALVNRIKIECTFQSLTTAYMEYLKNLSMKNIERSLIPSSLLVEEPSSSNENTQELTKKEKSSYETNFLRSSMKNEDMDDYRHSIDESTSKNFFDLDKQESIGAVKISVMMFGNFLIKVNPDEFESEITQDDLHKDTFYKAFGESLERTHIEETHKYIPEIEEVDDEGSDIISTKSAVDRRNRIKEMIENFSK